MTRHLAAARRCLARSARSCWRWMGPVRDGILDEMGKEEWKRFAAKTLGALVAGAASIKATTRDPDFWTIVIVPLIFAAFTGLREYAFHKQSGQAPPTPLPPQ